MKRLITTNLIWLAGILATLAAEPKLADELMAQAQAAYTRGDRDKALSLIERVIQENAQNAQAYYFRGRIHEDLRQHREAIASYDLALRLDPKASGIYQRRGCERFRLGHFQDALDDFDEFIRRAPDQEAQHWQRGIAHYYAGLFAAGKRQFELHQTVNRNDVENAVWHFLCVARLDGVEKARAALIPIKSDTRVPMSQIHSLFAGKATTNDVATAVKAGGPSPDELRRRQFYADLYLGLYFEATGDPEKAKAHIFKAAEVSKDHDYMGDVARVHAEVLRQRAAGKK